MTPEPSSEADRIGPQVASPTLDTLKKLAAAHVGDASKRTLAETRALMETFPQPLPDGMNVKRVDMYGASGEWIAHEDIAQKRVVLYLHGGGYVTGSAHSERRLASLIAAAADADCLSVDY